MTTLLNKKIIVTGAASGIGKAIAMECVKHGATVFALDIDKKGLAKLSTELKNKGEIEKIRTFNIDVSDSKQISRFFKTLGKDKIHPDHLINNAGIYLGKSIFNYNDKEIERVIAVNIKSAIFLSKEFAQLKIGKKKYGSIINVSSVSGQQGSSDAIYGMSKAALIGLTKSNALNFSPYIKVNAIAPGIVDTPLMKNISKERLKAHIERELIKDRLHAINIANTAIFLLSESGKNYTGATFDINNGCYLR